VSELYKSGESPLRRHFVGCIHVESGGCLAPRIANLYQ
jgi:hypothetical protein